MAVACEVMDPQRSASGKRRKIARRFRLRAKKEVMDDGARVVCGAGASSDLVPSDATDDKAPADRGARASTDMPTVVTHDEAPEDRGAHSPFEKVLMHVVSPRGSRGKSFGQLPEYSWDGAAGLGVARRPSLDERSLASVSLVPLCWMSETIWR